MDVSVIRVEEPGHASLCVGVCVQVCRYTFVGSRVPLRGAYALTSRSSGVNTQICPGLNETKTHLLHL